MGEGWMELWQCAAVTLTWHKLLGKQRGIDSPAARRAFRGGVWIEGNAWAVSCEALVAYQLAAEGQAMKENNGRVILAN